MPSMQRRGSHRDMKIISIQTNKPSTRKPKLFQSANMSKSQKTLRIRCTSSSMFQVVFPHPLMDSREGKELFILCFFFFVNSPVKKMIRNQSFQRQTSCSSSPTFLSCHRISVQRPVHVPIPHPVLVPQPQAYPLHIPVAKPYAVPVVKEITIPIEKIVPYPVVKRVPYTVEKHVPYHVEKFVTVHKKVPYAIKVPIVKTIIHRVNAHGHGRSRSYAWWSWSQRRRRPRWKQRKQKQKSRQFHGLKNSFFIWDIFIVHHHLLGAFATKRRKVFIFRFNDVMMRWLLDFIIFIIK